MDFLQPNCIEIGPLMSQEVSENPEIHNDAIRSWCDPHSRQYRTTQTIGTCFMMYLSFNSRYQYSHRCFTSWRCIFRTSQFFRCSIARFTIRFYVISQANTCIESRFVRFCNLHIDAWSRSRHITLKKLARKLQTMHRWKNSRTHRWKRRIYIVEKVCTKTSDSIEYRADDTNDCCEKVLKIQFSQMCCNQNPVDIIWRKKN